VALSCSVSRPVTTNESRQPPASLSYLFHTGHANKIAYRRVINNSLGRQSEEVRRQGQEDLTVLRNLVWQWKRHRLMLGLTHEVYSREFCFRNGRLDPQCDKASALSATLKIVHHRDLH
jgi:hypothetical protein